MKKIAIPADIEIVGVPNVSKYTFKEFLENCVNDVAFGRNLTTLESRVAIKKAFTDQGTGVIVELTSAAWETLAAVAREPTNPYVPKIAEQVLPFIYAIVHPKE